MLEPYTSIHIILLPLFISLSYFASGERIFCCVCTTIHPQYIISMDIMAFSTTITIFDIYITMTSNERDGASNHQPHDCLLNNLFRQRWKKTSKLRVTGLCEGNSPVTGDFPVQRASNAENVSIWWRHYEDMPLHVAQMQSDSRICYA